MKIRGWGMKYFFKLILGVLFALNSAVAADVIVIEKNSYKVLDFNKMIKNIKVSNSEFAEVTFVQNPSKPFRAIKVLGREYGNVSLHITFFDDSMTTRDIDIVKNIKSVINTAKSKYPQIKITQTNDNIIIDGVVPTDLDKEIIKNMFKHSGFDVEKQYIDLSKTDSTKKMVRIKLYIAEIDNSKGQTIKNNWMLGYRNYQADGYDDDSIAMRQGFGVGGNNALGSYTGVVNEAMSNILAQSVSLTGGLTSAANYLSKNFNVGLTLNYLSSQGVATVLTETTLVTTEEKGAKFHAGGEIVIETSSSTAQGLPTTELQSKEYGIILEILASKIINDDFIDLTVSTSSTKIDWANQVKDMPGFKNQSVTTNFISKSGSTIILGGLIDKEDVKNLNKVPFLGDIPIIGHLFRSKDFQSGNSELVFFITPEIIEPTKDDNIIDLEEIKRRMQESQDAVVEASKIETPKISSSSSKQNSVYDEYEKTVNNLLK
jgi:pilus assembly protein CpaC